MVTRGINCFTPGKMINGFIVTKYIGDCVKNAKLYTGVFLRPQKPNIFFYSHTLELERITHMNV